VCLCVRRASARAVTEGGAALKPAICARQRGDSGEQAGFSACRHKGARAPARRCMQGADMRWLAARVLMPPVSWPMVVPAAHGRARSARR
jgi:hypothetical protein